MDHMAHYFDAYRIDHVLGFFRIWEVPTHQHWGTMGHFRPALPLTESEVRGYGFTAPLAHCLAPFVSAQRMQALCADFGPAFATHYFVPDADFDGFRLRPGLTTQSAIAFLAFALLYTPCVAAISAMRKELGSGLKTAGVVIGQCCVAWIVAFAVYCVAGLVL